MFYSKVYGRYGEQEWESEVKGRKILKRQRLCVDEGERAEVELQDFLDTVHCNYLHDLGRGQFELIERLDSGIPTEERQQLSLQQGALLLDLNQWVQGQCLFLPARWLWCRMQCLTHTKPSGNNCEEIKLETGCLHEKLSQ